MELAAHPILGELSEAELDYSAVPRQGRGAAASTRRRIQFSLLCSVAIHLLLVASTIYFIGADSREGIEHLPATFAVEFVPRNPQSSREAAQAVEAVEPEQVTAPAAPTEISSQPPEEVLPISQEQPLVNIAEGPDFEGETDANSQAPNREAVPLSFPSAESLRSVITSLQRSDEAARFSLDDCNRLEREQELIRCNASADGGEFALSPNPVYRAFNPAFESNRSRETVTTIAGQTAGIAAALTPENLPTGLSAYLLEEIEQGIEIQSNNSVRSVDHMNRMVDKSYAGEQSRRIFDTWVQQRSKELQRRRVAD